MVFGDKTDLRRMLDVLRDDSVRHRRPAGGWTTILGGTIPLGHSRLEGTAEIVGDDLVRRLGVSNGRESTACPSTTSCRTSSSPASSVLAPDPWNERLNFMEHVEFFMAMKERGLLCTCLQDVVVEHHPRRPRHYEAVRTNTRPTWTCGGRIVASARRSSSGAGTPDGIECATTTPASPPTQLDARSGASVRAGAR